VSDSDMFPPRRPSDGDHKTLA